MSRRSRSKGGAITPDSIARNTAYSFAAQMTTAALTAVLTIFLVRQLGPSGFGIFGLATSVSSVVMIVADFGISAATARFAAERRGDPEAVARLYVDALKLKMAVTGSVCLLLALLAAPIADLYGEPELIWPLRAIALATFGQSLMFMGDAFFAAMGKIVIRLRITATEAATEVSASVALVLLGGGAAGAAFGRSIGYVCGAILSIAMALRLVGRPRLRLRRPPSRATVRTVGRYASSLMVVDASYVLSSNANVLLIGGYLGSAAAGIFRAPSRLIPLLQYPGQSVANGVAPRVSRRAGHEPDVKALQGGLRGLILLQAILLAPIIVWAQPIVSLLLGPGYERAAHVLQLQAPYIFLTGIGPLLTLSINYLGEARRRIPIAVGTLVLTIVGAVILIPKFGLGGAAIGTDIAYGFYALGHLWLCRRALNLSLAPLVKALGCSLLAATAMGLFLRQLGTSGLGPVEWIVGLGGGVATLLVLRLTRQIRKQDVEVVVRKLRRKGAPSRRSRPPAGEGRAAAPHGGEAGHDPRATAGSDTPGVLEDAAAVPVGAPVASTRDDEGGTSRCPRRHLRWGRTRFPPRPRRRRCSRSGGARTWRAASSAWSRWIGMPAVRRPARRRRARSPGAGACRRRRFRPSAASTRRWCIGSRRPAGGAAARATAGSRSGSSAGERSEPYSTAASAARRLSSTVRMRPSSTDGLRSGRAATDSRSVSAAGS